VLASPFLALILFAAPQLDVPAGSPVTLDGNVQEEEWADATTIRQNKQFVRVKRDGRWLNVAFGGEGRYGSEVLRILVSDEAGAWQTVLLLSGGQPTLPPALWARSHPSVIKRMLRDARAPLKAPRGVQVRMNVSGMESWSAEYRIRLGVLGIGRGERRTFRCRLVLEPRGAPGGPTIVYPPNSPDSGSVRDHAVLVSSEQWGVGETWKPLSEADSAVFDDHQLLWRLAVENDRFKMKGAEGQIVIGSAVRPLSRSKVAHLRRQIETGMKRNPTLPAWTHFLGRLLHEANFYDEATKLIDSIPPGLRRMDAFAVLAAEHFLDLEEWEVTQEISAAYPNAPGMRELAVAANTVRTMVEADAELEKRAQAGGEDLPLVRFTTRSGVIEIELFEDSAPHTVSNFVDLATRRYFDGMRFSPVIGSSIVRSGDPRTRAGGANGPDGPPWKLRRDRTQRQPLSGRLVAITAEDGVTHGSQFGVLLAPVIEDRDSVVVFGRVTKGMNILRRLEDGDELTKVEVVRRRNHSYDALASRVK